MSNLHTATETLAFPTGCTRNIGVGVDWAVNGRRERLERRDQETENIRHSRPLKSRMFVSGSGSALCLFSSQGSIPTYVISSGQPQAAIGFDTPLGIKVKAKKLLYISAKCLKHGRERHSF